MYVLRPRGRSGWWEGVQEKNISLRDWTARSKIERKKEKKNVSKDRSTLERARRKKKVHLYTRS